MDIWSHSLISTRKFGGDINDYYAIHKFIDSSKLFVYSPKHRLLLHNLYGVELIVEKFNDYIVNSDNQSILVRDIAIEHIKEDHSKKVPSLNDWLKNNDKIIRKLIQLPSIKDPVLEEFVMRPLLRSNLKSSLLITLSNFGVYLASEILGVQKAKLLNDCLLEENRVDVYLQSFKFSERWQFTPDIKELNWLKDQSELK